MSRLRLRLLTLLGALALLLSQLMLGAPPVAAQSGTNLALLASVQTDSDYDANYTGVKAKDGVVSQVSKWTSNDATATHWISYDLGGIKSVTGFVVKHA